MVDLAYDWSLMGWGMRAVVIALAVVLAIVLVSPHVAVLKPIAQRLGLVTTVTQTIYVPVNHTVYVNRTIYVNQTVVRYINQTVPIYINRTVYVPVSSNASYFESYAGYCSGRLVFLPNDTAWIVWFWLAPKSYFESSQFLYWWYFNYWPPVYYNSTTHYAQSMIYIDALFVSPQGLSLYGWDGDCYVDNVTINNQYYILVCGDTVGYGPFMFNPFESGGSLSAGMHIIWNGTTAYEVVPLDFERAFITNNFAVVGNVSNPMTGAVLMPIPVVNTTYTGIMFMEYVPPNPNLIFIITPGPICDLTITFATNATAALWLPVTTNQTLFNYFKESVIPVFGGYNPYDNTMGYWVWDYPS
jgi:hypothetical protein